MTEENADEVGRDMITRRRKLTKAEINEHESASRKTYEDQKRAQNEFKAFASWAEPQIRRTLDPTYSRSDEGKPLAFEEARALQNELERRRKHKAARVAKLRADRLYHLNASADGFLYEVHDCRIVLDASGTQAKYVDIHTLEVVHHRKATAAERQMSLPDDEIPDGAVAS